MSMIRMGLRTAGLGTALALAVAAAAGAADDGLERIVEASRALRGRIAETPIAKPAARGPNSAWRRWIERDDWHGRWRGGRDVKCRAYDRGWEEHWGGHGGGRDWRSACGACKKPGGVHDRCTYRCTTEEYRCTAVFIPDDTNGRRETYRGDGEESRWDAEASAERECRRDNRERAGTCRIDECRQEQETVDSGSC